MTNGSTNFSEKPDMPREDIVAALHKKGWSLRALSQFHGLKPTTLNNALNGPYDRGEKIIAETLGVDVCDIWPSRVARRERKRVVQQLLESI
ncbi:helix-turn-helix domain-containing protein [Vibrio parahaemolyticus]|uniref:helix-turn-helix domain-containing protein n=2 Tax=Vibrio parahaemolyticus TaxID=670 RepID=UPI00155322A5|nr:helix-turn-helix domain-containing protein [Vibrio parahaemolyticus]EJB8688812.1 helix-turn-helix domain-containing protein [Vibrio parahaemolyticus]MEA5282087.1 helix-turn-helix domain-containing protein [Vibrio parahaemolyticus]